MNATVRMSVLLCAGMLLIWCSWLFSGTTRIVLMGLGVTFCIVVVATGTGGMFSEESGYPNRWV